MEFNFSAERSTTPTACEGVVDEFRTGIIDYSLETQSLYTKVLSHCIIFLGGR